MDMNFSSISNFFKKAVSMFSGEAEHSHGQSSDLPEETIIYNDVQVKAGLIHLRNDLSSSTDPNWDKYNESFFKVRLKPEMTREEIDEQMQVVLKNMVEKDLIESDLVDSQAYLANLMTNTVINSVATRDMGESAIASIRFEQELRTPKLHIVTDEPSEP